MLDWTWGNQTIIMGQGNGFCVQESYHFLTPHDPCLKSHGLYGIVPMNKHHMVHTPFSKFFSTLEYKNLDLTFD